jgi:hypothetical protein
VIDRSRAGNATRRHVGRLTAGALVALLNLGARDARPARKKKPRCEKLGTRCNPETTRRVCCGALVCQPVSGQRGDRCCKPRFTPCAADTDCCANLTCVGDGRGFCDVASNLLPFSGSMGASPLRWREVWEGGQGSRARAERGPLALHRPRVRFT